MDHGLVFGTVIIGQLHGIVIAPVTVENIDRLGIDSLEAAIADGDLLERRDAILSAPIKERT